MRLTDIGVLFFCEIKRILIFGSTKIQSNLLDFSESYRIQFMYACSM